MKLLFPVPQLARFSVAALLAAFMLGAGMAGASESIVNLTGADETPPVKTVATGTATITVNPDKTVGGSVMTQGFVGTMAHIHLGPAGKAGPALITLDKKGDNNWVVPLGSKLTDEQYASYKAGDLYINVHSDANKGGEIRGQIKP